MTSIERRGAPRFPLYVQIDYRDAPQGVRDFTENLSASGMFIRTDRSFKVGERVTLILSFPALLEPLTLTCEVMRLQPAKGPEQPGGIGVRVPDDLPEDRRRLEAFAKATEGQPGSASRTRDFVVLVVEDNNFLAQMYGDTLRSLLAEVRLLVDFAPNGEQALARMARQPRVDLVFTDLMMPVLDGFGLIERVRADSALKRTPLVVVSSLGPFEEARAMNLGASAFLRKPVRLPDLLGTVKALLNLQV